MFDLAPAIGQGQRIAGMRNPYSGRLASTNFTTEAFAMGDLEQKVQRLEELNRVHARQIDALRQVIDTLLLVNGNLVAFADSNCTVHFPPWIRESQQSIQDAKEMLRNLDRIEGMGL